MKMKIFLLLVISLFWSCSKKQIELGSNREIISDRVSITKGENNLELHSGNFTSTFKNSELPLKRVVLLNSSLVGYFDQLGLENTIVGVSSPTYIYSIEIQNLISKGTIANVGNEQKYDIEKIISLKPDIIFTNYISSYENTYDVLKRSGIPIVFLDEYLEKTPLEKTRYLKIFGSLLGKSKEADSLSNAIESSYNELKNLAKQGKKSAVMVNEMYGGMWFMAGGESQTAKYIEDANANYILQNDASNNSVSLSFEEVLIKSKNVPFWVNAGNYSSRKELLGINPNYSKIRAFRENNVYSVGRRQKAQANDFFELGVVRSDLVLKDYIKIFHPELLPKDSLMFLQKLN